MSKWGTSASGNVRNGPREEASIAGTLAGKSVPRVLSRLGVSPEWQDWTSGALEALTSFSTVRYRMSVSELMAWAPANVVEL